MAGKIFWLVVMVALAVLVVFYVNGKLGIFE